MAKISQDGSRQDTYFGTVKPHSADLIPLEPGSSQPYLSFEIQYDNRFMAVKVTEKAFDPIVTVMEIGALVGGLSSTLFSMFLSIVHLYAAADFIQIVADSLFSATTFNSDRLYGRKDKDAQL